MIHSFVNARTDQVFFRQEHSFTSRQLAEMIWTVSQQNILRFLEAIPRERQLRVRFEDLVNDPRSVLEQVCRFLQVEFDPIMLDPYDNGKSRMTDGIHPLSKMLGDVKFHTHKTVSASVADQWRKDKPLTLMNSTWQMAEILGYPREDRVDDATSRRELKPIQRLSHGEKVNAVETRIDSLTDDEVARLVSDLLAKEDEDEATDSR